MKWWSTYPRKIGYPWKIIVNDAKEMVEKFNYMNGNVNKLYVGLYKCAPKNQSNIDVTINLAAFDIDWDGKYETMVELHNHCLKNNWKHQVMFSTNGFWIYVLTEERTYNRQSGKKMLAGLQQHIIEGTSLKFGDSKTSPLDRAIFGDIERITRFPGSYDKGRERHVIFLDQKDIDLGWDHIVKVSETASAERRMYVPEFGDLLLDPDKIGPLQSYQIYEKREFDDVEYDFEIPEDTSDFSKKILGLMPDPVKAWVLTRMGWKARAYATLWMREQGFTKEITESFLKPFYEKMKRTDHWDNNWNHYLNCGQVSDNIFRRLDLKFPNTQTLVDEGLVPSSYLDRKRSLVYK